MIGTPDVQPHDNPIAWQPGAGWLRPALLALLVLAFGLRSTELARQNIWWDEARNIDVALRPFLQVATSPELDIQPPLYYWGLHGWLQALGIERGAPPAAIAWAARWLSLGAGLAGVALVAALARRMAGARAVLAAAALAAFSPFWLAESQETRMYTVGLALLAAAATALLRLAQAPGRPARTWQYAAFALLSAAALLVHYNTVFVLVAWYIWWGAVALLGADRWRRLRAPFLTGLATLLLVLPVLPIALRQIPGYANPNLVVPSLVDYLRQNWQGHVAGYAWDPAAMAGRAPWWLWGALIAGSLGLAIAVARTLRLPASSDRRATLYGLSLLGVWLIGGLLLYYVAVLDRGAFNVRYSAFVTPALLVLLGVGIAAWGRWAGGLLLALVVAGLLSFARADLFDPRFAREDTAGLADWLREQTGPGDVILVDQKYPFGFYYGRYAIPPAEPPDGPEAAPARYLFVDINTVDEALNQWAAGARRVFWVQWFESDTDPRHAVSFLLDQAGEHAGEEWFQGWSVDWWEMEPPNRFVLAGDLRPLSARFQGAADVVEASFPARAAAAGPLPVVLRWQRAQEPPANRPLKARVALYNAQGDRLAQADERLLNDRHLAPGQWAAQDQPLNVYLLEVGAALQPGLYDLKLLLYDADTLEPLTLLDAAGNPAGIEAILGQIQIEPDE